MTAPISQITVYSNASVLGSTLVTVGTFPVDNSSQRSATLRGENCVKICFKAGQSIAIPAFSFIEYDGQLFFLKETYRPVPKGNSYYEYNMKFVSFDNMLSKPQAYRKVVVDGETWNEPDIDVVGNLADIATIIKDSIIETAGRYEGVFADMLSKVELVNAEININSESKAFSYSGQKISQVLDAIANEYEIDYWFEQVGDTQNGITKMILHFAKCEILSGDLHVTDKTSPSNPFDKLHPTVSGGLDECTFSNEWSGVVQRITPFGSERNIKRGQAIANDMFVSFGKRLRLEYDHSCTIDGTTYQHAYAVKNEDGDLEPLYVDENGAVYVPGVTTGEESIEKYDDIYPRGHFRVTHVTQRGVDTQIYTVYAIPTVERNGQFVDLTDAEIDAMQADPTKKLFPIDIADGQTLSLHFESGYLNGREFEVANKSAKMVWVDGAGYKVDPDNVNAHWIACFEINPEGDNNDSPHVPYGNLIPRGKFDSTTGYEGDMFAIFNMDMPAFYVEDAQNELAQKAYDEIVGILSTRPEVKCKGNEVYFKNHSLFLGQRIFVKSDLFGQDNQGQPLEFISRVTNYSHPLSKPNNVDFRLCSSRVQGAISVMKGAIADQTSDIMGVGQTARSLSRRAFRDAQEMIGMLQAVVAEMMVVGVERNQFQFTMGIECLKATGSDGIMHFDGLKITAGELQHTQEPYIKDAWEGHYSLLSETTLKADHNGNAIDKSATDTYRNTPYYLYAVINSSTGQVSMELWADKKDGENDEAYLLLGILSSEFLDGNTSLRVFNRSNGFTQIAGGTITTEQLQDPTRQLIIDMSSNPPRIIAKRGAQIIGNITFISSNGTETNLATKITSMDGDIAEAQENASDALEKANNIADDGIISGGTEKATIKKEWQEIAGDNMLHNTNGSYKKALNQASEYGVTSGTEITNINTAYAALESAMQTIVGYSNSAWSDANMHIDTYLMKDDGTAPTVPTGTNYLAKKRSEFSALWRAYYDAEIALLHLVSDIIDQREIGGENLYTGTPDFNIPAAEHAFGTYYTGVKVSTGVDYVVSAKQVIVGYASTIVVKIKKSGQTDKEVAHIGNGGLYTQYKLYDTFKLDATNDAAYDGGEIVLTAWYGGSGNAQVKSFMVQVGTKPTTYQTHVKYLTEAFENAARQGSTDIDGGLLMTCLLKLRNLAGSVTAGMSGLTEDAQGNEEPILMWGGANYQQALEAALPKAGQTLPDYKYTDGGVQKLITTLLRKDGTGKIGVFYIEDDNAQVKTQYGVVKLDDDDGVSCILPDGTVAIRMTPKTLPDISTLLNQVVTGTIYFSDEEQHTVHVDTLDEVGDYALYGDKITKTHYLARGGTIKLTGSLYQYQTSYQDIDSISQSILYVVKKPDGTTLSSGSLDTAKTITAQTSGTHTIEVQVRFMFNFRNTDRHAFIFNFDNRYAATGDYTYNTAEKQTMLANGGLFTFQGDKSYLYYKDGIGLDCQVGNYRLKISNSGVDLEGLPTSDPHVAGRLYAKSDDYILRVSAG